MRTLHAIRKRAKSEVRLVKREVVEKLSTFSAAAFGLVAALAWNSAIQAVFRELFGSAEGVWPLLSYAVTVSIIAVLVTIWIGRIAQRVR